MPPASIIRRLTAFQEAHPEWETMTVTQLANAIGSEQSALSRAIKRHYGKSLIELRGGRMGVPVSWPEVVEWTESEPQWWRLTNQEAADRLGVSRDALRKMVKYHTGLSYNEFRTRAGWKGPERRPVRRAPGAKKKNIDMLPAEQRCLVGGAFCLLDDLTTYEKYRQYITKHPNNAHMPLKHIARIIDVDYFSLHSAVKVRRKSKNNKKLRCRNESVRLEPFAVKIDSFRGPGMQPHTDKGIYRVSGESRGKALIMKHSRKEVEAILDQELRRLKRIRDRLLMSDEVEAKRLARVEAEIERTNDARRTALAYAGGRQ